MHNTVLVETLPFVMFIEDKPLSHNLMGCQVTMSKPNSDIICNQSDRTPPTGRPHRRIFHGLGGEEGHHVTKAKNVSPVSGSNFLVDSSPVYNSVISVRSTPHDVKRVPVTRRSKICQVFYWGTIIPKILQVPRMLFTFSFVTHTILKNDLDCFPDDQFKYAILTISEDVLTSKNLVKEGRSFMTVKAPVDVEFRCVV